MTKNNRTLLTALTICVTLIVGVVVGLLLHPVVFRPIVEKDAASPIQAGEQAVLDSASKQKLVSLRQLGIRHAYLGEKKVAVGFYDSSNQTFYRWKEIVLELDQVPPSGPFPRVKLLDVTKLRVLVVDPPLSFYRKTYAEYIPGHLNANMGIFYQWKKTVVSPTEIPWAYIGADGRTSAVRGDDFHQVIEIEPPQFILQQPMRWKRPKKQT